MLVELSAWHIRHSIALVGVVRDLGDQLPDLLSPATLASLSMLGPGGHHRNEQGEEEGERAEAGWLEYMQQAISRR
jgi:hypothetical protein